MFWFTEGKPENWPILVRGHEEAIYERFDMQLTTFLARIMSLEIVLPHIWLTEMFQDPTRRVFQPFEFKRKDPQLKNVFQLYEENRNKAGFWVQHEIWEASDTDVIVKSIDGKSEGRLFDNTTDSGAASVRVDVYVDGVLNQENLELPIALDPGFRLVPPPKWWVT